MLSSRPLTLAVLGLGLVAAGCDRQTTEQAQPGASASAPAKAAELTGTVDRSHKGEPLPDFTARDPGGKTLALKSVKGPVLINLWATWCAPCVTELPMLDELARTTRVVTVSQDLEGGAKVAEFLKAKGLTRLEPWLDPGNDLAFKFGGGTLPTSIYYDAAGKEIWRVVGGYDWTGPEAAKLLAEAH